MLPVFISTVRFCETPTKVRGDPNREAVVQAVVESDVEAIKDRLSGEYEARATDQSLEQLSL